jgi:tripartite-type tricarboxylate transporter receptor subunit TctC
MRSDYLSAARRSLLRAAALTCAAVLPMGAFAQADFPNKPITLVVSYPAGGISDLLGRKLAEQLGKAWGQSVVVDNRAGGNQIVAATSVKRAAPDGYTLMLCDDGVFTLNPILFRKLSYEPRELMPIIDLADAKIVLSMAKEVPAGNFQEMVTYAKANPGKLNYASLGVGNIHHLMLETLKRQTGTDLAHVPYRGYPQAIQDVLANRAQLVSGGIGGPVIEYLRSGALKGIAVTGAQRSPLIPNVPTFAELGLPNLQPKVHFILVGPAGMPAPVVERINTTVARILKSPEFQQTVLAPNGLEPLGQSASAVDAGLKKARDAYEPLVKEIGVVLD